ncbi:MAG: ABC transporter permease [Rhodoplanes sp.]|uniref:ABC transporter permease n=1 Tax=Rhodoplanes sp. TaxID=1968906 RepID=UPI00182756FE|nr:ABC transporter permease [Rhodoplanes sp.]NVO15924.1 ABC transporter permease [Rhodoplanes sp.]
MWLNYALRELLFRRSRSLVTVLSIAVAVIAAVLLTALAASYARAIRAPVETVGADVVVQITGDIPPKLEGLVFPHPNALVPAAATATIGRMAGVISVTRGVYMWELAPDHYQSVLGIEDGEAGLGSLSSRLIAGKPLHPGDRAILLDSDFASKNGVQVGAELDIGGTKFPVAGIVDAARGGKVVRADVYMPLAPAQELAAGAPMVQALYPFRRDDANLLLVKVDRQTLESVVDRTVAMLGKKGIVSSELSFREALSGVLFLSQRMGLIVAVVIGVFAAAFVLRATASAIAERRRELAVLQAVGWPWRLIRRQVLIENGMLALAGVALGVLLAVLIAAALGHISVTLDLPWDLSSTPHFIPDATLDRTQTITVPITVPWEAAVIAAAGGVMVALAAALALAASPPPQPWSLLRSE